MRVAQTTHSGKEAGNESYPSSTFPPSGVFPSRVWPIFRFALQRRFGDGTSPRSARQRWLLLSRTALHSLGDVVDFPLAGARSRPLDASGRGSLLGLSCRSRLEALFGGNQGLWHGATAFAGRGLGQDDLRDRRATDEA